MKKLIINADDYGLCDSVNRGILECFQQGMVSDFSFMINLAEFEKAVSLLAETGISKVGLHLNLTVGKSVLNAKTELTDSEGHFFNLKTLFLKIIGRKISEQDIYQEVVAQLQLLKDHGYTITHIDSHTNIHTLPQIMKPLLQAMEQLDLNVPIRMPYERQPAFLKLTASNLIRIILLNLLTLNSRLFTKYQSPVNTIGGNFFNNSNPDLVFTDILNRIHKSRFNLFELAVHPGYPSDDLLKYDTYANQRVDELNFLAKVSPVLKESWLQICNFHEISNNN